MQRHEKETICFFSALYDPHIGGVESFTKNLAHELAKEGYRVLIATSNHAGLPAKEHVGEFITVFRLPCYPLFDSRLPLPKKNTEFKRIMNELNNESIDHVCINTRFYPHSLIGARFAREKNITPIVIEHGSDYLTFGNSLLDVAVRAYEHRITKRLLAFHPVFFGISSKASEWLRNFNIESSGQITNAIDGNLFRSFRSPRDFRAEFNIPENDILVAFVGRLTPEKGIGQLVSAASLLEHRKDVHFLVAGAGPLQEKLERIAPPSLHFLGSLAHSDLSALLQCADIFCLPTRSEGFATVLLEAAVCKTTPIITKVGGTDELIPTADYGILIEDDKPSTIAHAIDELCDKRESICEISEKIKNRAEGNYNWQETTRMLLEAFNFASKQA